ncbi:Uncharacterised protein [Bordetella pertussis]|nr:Uncharacterised protein [Bordetella pertussis]
MMPHTLPSPSLQVRELLQLLAHHYQLQRQWSKTVALLAALDALDAIDSQSLLALALGYLHQGEPRMALVTLDKRALRATPDAAGHLVRAQAMQALNRPDDARQAMRDYMALRAASCASAPPP